jgi:hypothetical protein
MARNKQKKVLSHKFHNSAGVPAVPVETDRKNLNGRDFHTFGTDNLFPQAVAALNRKSPVHAGIINYKTVYTLGKGFQVDESNKDLLDLVAKTNGSNESLRAVFKKIIKDFNSFGNAYLEIVTDHRRSFISFFHIDATKPRMMKDMKHLVIHPDWRQESRFDESQREVLPLYPEFEEIDGQLRSVWHFKQYEPEFSIYGIPKWVSGLDAAGIGYKTNKWNISRLDNAFQTSGVLLIDGNMSTEDAKELQDDFSSKMTGEGNQGKILMIVKSLGKSEGTQFVPINNGSDGDWIKLHDQSTNDLVTAHQWFRSLSGISDNTGFDSSRILNEYEIALATVITEDQNFYLDAIRIILTQQSGIDASELEFINKPPVSIATLIDANKITTVNEGRAALGLPIDDSLEGDRFIENDLTSGSRS